MFIELEDNIRVLNELQQKLKEIENIEKYAIDNNLLDTQEYLNFQDALNKFSIDPDRIDK